jgi:hypothetical protein
MIDTKINTIRVHGGRAHADDLLATALFISYNSNVKCIVRESPIKGAIKPDNEVWLDCGERYDPEGGYFDHHQNEKAVEDQCAFSLVLNYFTGLNNEELEAILGLNYTFTVLKDCKGFVNAGKQLTAISEEDLELCSEFSFSMIEGLFLGLFEKNMLSVELLKALGDSLRQTIEVRKSFEDLLKKQASLVKTSLVIPTVIPAGCKHIVDAYIDNMLVKPAFIVSRNAQSANYSAVKTIDGRKANFASLPSSIVRFRHKTDFLVVFSSENIEQITSELKKLL